MRALRLFPSGAEKKKNNKKKRSEREKHAGCRGNSDLWSSTFPENDQYAPQGLRYISPHSSETSLSASPTRAAAWSALGVGGGQFNYLSVKGTLSLFRKVNELLRGAQGGRRKLDKFFRLFANSHFHLNLRHAGHLFWNAVN